VYGKDTDLIFPLRALPRLRPLRGPDWQMLVDRILAAPEASIEALAFSLMMVRLACCLTCTVDSYRALRGCTLCSEQAARRFRGSDGELLSMFEAACAEVAAHLAGGEAAGLLGLEEEVEVLYGW
jgi:hypothetical protein